MAITGISFNLASIRTLAPGSDNWPITWADDDHQYTCWGDGGGFGGTNTDGRVSWGFGRVEGQKDNYNGFNVWGGFNPENPGDGSQGKSEGIICVGGILYAFNNDPAGGGIELWRSTDHAASWSKVIDWASGSFGSESLTSWTFLNFGKNNAGARDTYVYAYAFDRTGTVICGDDWDVQYPGRLHLMRVPAASITTQGNWEFFSGTAGSPAWSSDQADRAAVLTDATNGIMRTGVIYVPAASRYLMTAQQVSRHWECGAAVGVFEAPEPWGPWTLVRRFQPWQEGIKYRDAQDKTTTFFVSPKWWNGLNGVLVYTGPSSDAWGTVEFALSVSTGDELATPSIIPDGGNFYPSVEVSFSSPDNPDEFYYTLDGSTPTTGSTAYNDTPFTLTATTTVKVLAVKSGWTDSPIATATFTLSTPGTLDAPTILPGIRTFTDSVEVSFAHLQDPDEIYYTLDGSDPIIP